MLRCNALNYSYGAKKVLHDITADFPSSGLVGILGHNGSGKSTLLKILCGILRSHSGSLELDGRPMFTAQGGITSDIKKCLGIVLQDTSSDEKLSVEENLSFYARLMGVPKNLIPSRIEAMIKAGNLEKERATLLKKLSGGTRRRVELYRAFLHTPRLLILDEPTTGLDSHEQKRFFSFAQEYAATHQALLIFSSHNSGDFSFCDDVIMMHDGRIIAHAHPEELLKQTQPFLLEFEQASGLKNLWLTKEELEQHVINNIKESEQAFSVRKAHIADVYEAKVRDVYAQ